MPRCLTAYTTLVQDPRLSLSAHTRCRPQHSHAYPPIHVYIKIICIILI